MNSQIAPLQRNSRKLNAREIPLLQFANFLSRKKLSVLQYVMYLVILVCNLHEESTGQYSCLCKGQQWYRVKPKQANSPVSTSSGEHLGLDTTTQSGSDYPANLLENLAHF